MLKPLTVEQYIESCPKEHREKLTGLRNLIKETVPEADEKISYGMPYYDYKGRLVYFALSKKHIGLYFPPPIVELFSNELNKYETSKSAIRFPLNISLPVNLIRKLIETRRDLNEKK